MNETVAAVIVTRNRLTLLRRCLENLERQTRKLDAIYVVNVASSDGTAEFLQSYGSPVIPISLTTNAGSGGGQHAGIGRAHADGHHWVWAMDDDGYPSPDALKLIMEHANDNCDQWLNSLVLDHDNPRRLAFSLLLDGKFVKEAEDIKNMGLLLPDANPFNGTLIGRTIIDRIGLPCPDLFIWGDEEEYKRRAQLANFSVQTVTNSLFYHPGAVNGSVSAVPLPGFWKYYYYVRNSEATGMPDGKAKLSFRGAFRRGMGLTSWIVRDSLGNIARIWIIQRAILAALINDLKSYYPKK